MTTETTTTQTSGNTNPSVFRSRAFLFTLNQVDKYEEFKALILKLKSCDYFVAAKEKAPTTGHEHIHAYVHFTNAYKLSKKILAIGAHIDICKGSPQQNITYVKKDGNILDEVGDEPHQGFHTVKDLKETPNPDTLNWNEYNTWKKIHSEMDNDIDIDDWHKDIKVYYIQGPSGIGKTEKAKEIVRQNREQYGGKVNVVKFDGNFWLGVGTAKVAIYDDFRDSHMKASEFINFIDYNTHTLNVKGGFQQNRYNLIIITSVQRLDDIYKSCQGEPRTQWLRRIEVINMYPDESQDLDIDDML